MDMMRLLLSAGAALLISVPALVAARLKGSIGRKPEQILEEARAAGRQVTARQESAYRTKYHPEEKARSRRMRLWVCIYRYEVEGKTYTLRTNSPEKPPEEVVLYYPEGRPDKAVYEGKADRSGQNVFFALLPVLLWAVFYNFVFR